MSGLLTVASSALGLPRQLQVGLEIQSLYSRPILKLITLYGFLNDGVNIPNGLGLEDHHIFNLLGSKISLLSPL